jgi:hypothetical protein
MKTFIALLMGSMTAAPTMPDQATIDAGMAAWAAWMQKYAGQVADGGGPCGKTKLIGPSGISDTRNAVAGYVVVRAEDHQKAAEMFVGHPHFTIFPGTGVEVMEVLPIPGQ